MAHKVRVKGIEYTVIIESQKSGGGFKKDPSFVGIQEDESLIGNPKPSAWD